MAQIKAGRDPIAERKAAKRKTGRFAARRSTTSPRTKRNGGTTSTGGSGAVRPRSREIVHHPALSWKDAPAFMLELTEQGGTAALAPQFLILTAKRSGEVRGARWGEIDTNAKVWAIAGDRTKSGREHREPLSSVAVSILEKARLLQPTDPPAPACDALYFREREGEPLSDMAFVALLRRMGRTDLSAHGFRNSFLDWCAEATSFPRELAEAALAHVLENKTEASLSAQRPAGAAPQAHGPMGRVVQSAAGRGW
jgi:integrase